MGYHTVSVYLSKEITMTTISRSSAFRLADPFDTSDSLDTLFRGFFRPLEADKGAPRIRIDVKEDERQYVVRADLPGVDKDDIHVSVDGNTVSVSAEVKDEISPAAHETVLRRERAVGRMSRSFALESEIDESAAAARYQNGVLELRLPKKAAAAAKRLAVQ
jgi:HSP20 family protein